MNRKRSILIPIQWYYPGFHAGGLPSAIKLMVDVIAKDFNIFILTTDRDLGVDKPYPDLQPNIWHKTQDVQIKYLSLSKTNYLNIKAEIIALNPDVIYLKSALNPNFSIIPMWLKYRNKINSRLIIAPSGMLNESALKYKSWKKRPFLWFLKKSGLPKKVGWHATDDKSAKNITNQFGNAVPINILPEFPPKLDTVVESIPKDKTLSILFFSRIHPVKNLSFLLDVLKEINLPLKLTIVGPEQDLDYVATCKKKIKSFPANISVDWKGPISPISISPIIRNHHIMALPSQGEDFGYVILETLVVGRPVLISDQTPWRNLYQKRAGWDLSLDQPKMFVSAIKELYEMDQDTFDSFCKGALAFAKKSTDHQGLRKAYGKMFNNPV